MSDRSVVSWPKRSACENRFQSKRTKQRCPGAPNWLHAHNYLGRVEKSPGAVEVVADATAAAPIVDDDGQNATCWVHRHLN